MYVNTAINVYTYTRASDGFRLPFECFQDYLEWGLAIVKTGGKGSED